jgi:hypothetical protein
MATTATTTRRRDVEAFERLLWQWFDAESNVRAIREGNTPDWEAEGTKEAEAAATQALEAVLKAFEAEPDDASPKMQQPLPPQNSRDNDFP